MADEIAVEPERPEWLPEQFKAPEALVQSYEESRREMDRLRSQLEQERAQMAQERDAFTTALSNVPAPAAQPIGMQDDPLAGAYQRAYEEGDAAAMLRLGAQYSMQPMVEAVGKLMDDRFNTITPALEAQQAAQREATIRMAEDRVARELGPENYEALREDISRVAAANPNYIPTVGTVETYAGAIMNVAKLAQYERLQSENAALQQERLEKLGSQVVPGAGRASAFSQSEQESQWDKIKNAENNSFSQLMGR